VYTSADGTVYDGEFVSGRMEGYGILKPSKGPRYEGYFANNLYAGQGQLSWPNGPRYEGRFDNGKAVGEGVMIAANGTHTTFFNGAPAQQRQAPTVQAAPAPPNTDSDTFTLLAFLAPVAGGVAQARSAPGTLPPLPPPAPLRDKSEYACSPNGFGGFNCKEK
jgi:hypothetical protein